MGVIRSFIQFPTEAAMGQVINRFLDELVDVLAKITEIFGG